MFVHERTDESVENIRTLSIILDLSFGEAEGIVELGVAQNASGVWGAAAAAAA